MTWTERRLVNPAMRVAVRLGRDIDGVRELEVVGRRSGKPRRTPLKVLEVDGARYLVSLYGDSGWVLNLRARGRARLRFGRRVETLVAVELADDEKPPVIRAYLAGASREETRRRLSHASTRIPVFRLTPELARSPRPCYLGGNRLRSSLLVD